MSKKSYAVPNDILGQPLELGMLVVFPNGKMTSKIGRVISIGAKMVRLLPVNWADGRRAWHNEDHDFSVLRSFNAVIGLSDKQMAEFEERTPGKQPNF